MNLIQKYKNLDKEKQNTINILITFIVSIGWSLIKLCLGIFENSRFLIASSFFTMALALSKLMCLLGIIKHEEKYKKSLHIISCILIILSGIFYGIYNIRLTLGLTAANYGLIPSITIATVSFFLFIKALVFLIKDRNRDIYHTILRVIALISGSVDIVLTQMSLLAVEKPEMNPLYNCYLALAVAVMTIGCGIYCLTIKKRNK